MPFLGAEPDLGWHQGLGLSIQKALDVEQAGLQVSPCGCPALELGHRPAPREEHDSLPRGEAGPTAGPRASWAIVHPGPAALLTGGSLPCRVQRGQPM